MRSPDAPTDDRDPGPTRAATRWVVVRGCAVLAAVGHLSWVAESLSPSPLPTRTSYVSELFAVDQPWSVGFRTVDAVTGTLVAAGAVAAWSAVAGLRRLPGAVNRRLAAVATMALGVWGLGTAVDALLPLSCAPSVSAACAAAEAAGAVPTGHRLHTVSSAVSTTAVIVGFGALLLLAARSRRWLGSTRRRVAIAVPTAFLLVSAWVFLASAGAEPGTPLTGLDVGPLGWIQRLQITLSSVCLLTVAALVPRSRGVRP